MKPYQMLLHHQVHDFILNSRPRLRRQVYRLLAMLAADPFMSGHLQIRDERGRPLEILQIGDLEITFWADHHEKEVKVLNLRTMAD